ncbi:MAG: CotH kinase family protein [Clostridium sp.]|nr:CotH kinase family protein [Clostridium sp.]
MSKRTRYLNLVKPEYEDPVDIGVINDNMESLEIAIEGKPDRTAALLKPAINPDGVNGQVLMSNGDGSIKWGTPGTPSEEQVSQAVQDYLTEHPDATTSVEDGSISRDKLNDDMKDRTVVIAEPYSNAKWYVVGDVCVRDGKLYECNAPITTAEDWTEEHWTETNAAAVIEKKTRSVQAYAESSASQMTQRINNTQSSVNGALVEIDGINDRIDTIVAQSNGFVDYGYVQDGVAYFTHDGEVLFSITGIGGGGQGGGGSSAPSKVTVRNTQGWTMKEIASGAECPIEFYCESLEDVGGGTELPTGDVTLTIRVNSVVKYEANIAQGDVRLDIGPYLKDGTNNVNIKITDVYTQVGQINITVKAKAISVSSTYDTTVVITSGFGYPVTPYGEGSKTIHFKIDGREIGSVLTELNNRQLTYSIPMQSHGSHVLDVYATATMENGTEIESKHLVSDLIFVEEGNMTPVISMSVDKATVEQYTAVLVKYIVYTPGSLTSDVDLYVGEDRFSHLTVDRDQKTWQYRCDDVGSVVLSIESGSVRKQTTITVEESDMKIEAETDSLVYHLSAYGRSNSEANPATATFGDYSATFTGFTWDDTIDGWMDDKDGNRVLHVPAGRRVQIDYKPFDKDHKTDGFTLETEIAARDVLNYTTPILSCMSGGRGFEVTPQMARIASEQSALSTYYEDERRIRISVVVQKKSTFRLMYLYVDGVRSAACVYQADDDFQQASPVGITIGADDAGIDIYVIRAYTKDLDYHQIIENYTADTQNIDEKLELYNRNDIFDADGNVVINKLPAKVPYAIATGPEMPQYKGDIKNMALEFVKRLDPSRSFNVLVAIMNVQGTSSAGYDAKNYDMDASESGFEMNGTNVPTYAMDANAYPTDMFTFKADVASSNGITNTQLTAIYEDFTPYKTPMQEEDSRIRQAIEGFPMVMFHNDGNSTRFLGKYNFNNTKATPEVYGLDKCVCSIEFTTDASEFVRFHRGDITLDNFKGDGADFEFNYPAAAKKKPEKYPDAVVAFRGVMTWVASTWQDGADDSALDEPVTYGGVEYTTDSRAYRLAKFRAELADHFEVDNVIYHYIFTDFFLMVNNWGKNLFLTLLPNGKWICRPYDFDTAMGINNTGYRLYSPFVLNSDKQNGADIFDSQDSALFCNVRDAFPAEIKSIMSTMRSNGFTFANIMKYFRDAQSVWGEGIFNADSDVKYVESYTKRNNDSFLSMLRGTEDAIHSWWNKNRFRFKDSEFNIGDALSQYIELRLFTLGTFTLTSVVPLFLNVQVGSWQAQKRVDANTPTAFPIDLETVSNTESYLRSSDLLLDVGDLSQFHVGRADFARAPMLRRIILGSSDTSYENQNLVNLSLGNKPFLKVLDLRGSTEFAQAIDLTTAPVIDEVYLERTKTPSVSFARGATIRVFHIAKPSNLTLINTKKLEDLTIDDVSELTTVRIENIAPVIDVLEFLEDVQDNARVRYVGLDKTVADYAAASALYDTFDRFRGIDEFGENTETAQIAGTIHMENITGEQLAALQSRYPYITVDYQHIVSYAYFYADDGVTLLDSEAATDGSDVTYHGTTPTRESTMQYTYAHAGWSRTKGSETVDADALKNITADRKLYPVFTSTLRSHTITWVNSNNAVLKTESVAYGSTPTAPATPTDPSGDGNAFLGWSPAVTTVTGPQTYTATYESPVEVVDRTSELSSFLSALDGTADLSKTYKVGNYFNIDLGDTYGNGLSMQILGFKDKYMPDGTAAKVTVRLMQQLLGARPFNANGSAKGGWRDSDIRSFLESKDSSSVFASIPNNVSSRIVPVTNYSNSNINGQKVNNFETIDSLAIMSLREVSSVNGETLGPKYTSLLGTDASRVTQRDGLDEWYWLRTTTDSNSQVSYVDSRGSHVNRNTASSAGGIILTFCLDSTENASITSHLVNESWSEVQTAMQDGSYSTHYKLGDLIPITLTGEGSTYAELVAFDEGDSKMTFVLKHLLKDRKRFNPARAINPEDSSKYLEGTGTIGGYAKSELFTYYNETVKAKFPAEVQAMMVPVARTNEWYNTTGSKDSTTESNMLEVWVPSREEMKTTYASVFPDNASRKKMKIGSTGATSHWERSPYSGTGWYYVGTDGNPDTSNNAISSNGCAVGFQIGISGT